MKIQYVILVSVVMLLSACGGTTVLNASFQNDVYNHSPSPSLAGAPDGDLLKLVSPLENTVVKWTNQPPNNTSKAVQISSVPFRFTGMELIPAPGDQGDKYIL